MKTLPMILLAGTISFAGSAWAAVLLPTGESVAAGSANVTRNGGAMTVTNSNGTIINWSSFSVGANGTVQFVQPSSSSRVMNRVIESAPSRIDGAITSNGQVFLVNPSGIIVGPSGSIQASGIFLSTAGITDSDFLAGNLQFQAPPAETPIVMSGSLTATDLIDIRASSFDGSGGTLNATSINIDNGASPLPPLPLTGNITVGGDTISTVGGTINIGSGSNITVGGGSATGSVALTAGSINTQADTQKLLQRTGGAISLRVTGAIAPAPIAPASIAPIPQQTLTLTATLVTPSAPPAASTASLPGRGTVPAARLVNTGSLVDGAVTVRMSLVDLSPIALR